MFLAAAAAVPACPRAPSRSGAPSFPLRARISCCVKAGGPRRSSSITPSPIVKPRNPQARAALGRYLAMKGAVKSGRRARGRGEEVRARQRDVSRAHHPDEGDPRVPRRCRRLSAATPRSAFVASRDLQCVVPGRAAAHRWRGSHSTSRDVDELIWHDVVDRPIGLDSLNETGRPMGFEVFEALVPSIDVREAEMTLHSNNRSALSATGKRYQVLRWTDGVRCWSAIARCCTRLRRSSSYVRGGGSWICCMGSLWSDRLVMRNEPRHERKFRKQLPIAPTQGRLRAPEPALFYRQTEGAEPSCESNSSPHLMRNWYTTLVSS